MLECEQQDACVRIAMLRKEKHPDSQPTGTGYQRVYTLHTIWDLLEEPMTLSNFIFLL